MCSTRSDNTRGATIPGAQNDCKSEHNVNIPAFDPLSMLAATEVANLKPVPDARLATPFIILSGGPAGLFGHTPADEPPPTWPDPPTCLTMPLLEGAATLDLHLYVATIPALHLVCELASLVDSYDLRMGRRGGPRAPSSWENFAGAVACIAGNVLSAWGRDEPAVTVIGRGGPGGFRGAPVARRALHEALDALERSRFVAVDRGHVMVGPDAVGVVAVRPTGCLLALASDLGIGPDAVDEHFPSDDPRP